MDPIYLDYNATTPVAPEVAAAMMTVLKEVFGNPSSPHWFGVDAKDAVDRARGQVSALIGAEPDQVIFTGCATESNNIAILGTTVKRCATESNNTAFLGTPEMRCATESKNLAIHGTPVMQGGKCHIITSAV